MKTTEQIKAYLAGLDEPKRSEMLALHQLILNLNPACELWFLDGKDSSGKIVSNPNIGYGAYTLQYADGTSRAFYRIGLSANKTGISVYILGIKDKMYLAQTYGAELGKAKVSGYCIRFKTIREIHLDILVAAIRYGLAYPNEMENQQDG